MLSFLLNFYKLVNPLPEKNVLSSEFLIIKALNRQEKQAYRDLYNCYASSLLGIILRTVKSQEAAEYVLQEVFIKIYQSINQYRPAKGRLFTWMVQLAKESAVSYLYDTGAKVNIKPVDHLSTHQVLDLIYLEGHNHFEVAEKLHISCGTVKTRLRTGIQALRRTV